MLIDRYREELFKQAQRITKRKIKKAQPGTTLEMVIWGEEKQAAFLKCGWHPISESPRTDPADDTTWTEMTMRLDIPA